MTEEAVLFSVIFLFNLLTEMMNIETVDSYPELSIRGKNLIIRNLSETRNLLLCAATGSSPTGTYNLLAEEFLNDPELFSGLRIIKLDEWGGIPMGQPGTCESYLQKNLITPLQIPGSRYFGFNSNSQNPLEECNLIRKKLKDEGPVDLCILGLGNNGHLALNEPAEFLTARCHVAQLAPSSLLHSMTTEMPDKPRYGLTLGMADILQSKKILILISGIQKKLIVKQFLTQNISPFLPASFLWLHPDVTCIIESNLL